MDLTSVLTPMLTPILAAVIVLGVLIYVILDGFDLGVGILFPFMPDQQSRDVAVASVTPVWDGNETWLILGGATLFGAFPTAYAVALPAFYIPIMLMLFALIFRGVAFEFRAKATRTRRWWDGAFVGGSTLAAFCQGVLLGAMLEGVRMEGHAFTGGALDWLSPFSLVCGIGVVAGYALLGATWLIMKTEGPQLAWAGRAARLGLLLSVMALAVVSVYTPLQFPDIRERWFGAGHWLLLTPVPLASAVVVISLLRELRAGSTYGPFGYAIALFTLSYLGIGISLWPNILRPGLTVWDAAAPPASQGFVAVALLLSLPMVLIYTGYAYWVFRGKVRAGDGYAAHH